MILQANPGASYLAYREEIDAAVKRVLEGGWYILGREVEAFESEFAAYCETSYAVGVSDGTNAILLALKALGIGAGDEVITTGHTAVATVTAIELAGATPVLVDIAPQTYTLSTVEVAAAITHNTRAIIAVHLYGNPAKMNSLMNLAEDHGLLLIEDCAQAHGARYDGMRVGSMGIVGTFSFYPTKNLGAFGDGGAVVTSDIATYERLRALRQYGWEERYISSITGYNSRLDELQAAMLRVKLKHLDADNQKRRDLAAIYDEVFVGSSIVTPVTQANAEHVYHLYVIQVEEREELMSKLRERRIGSAIHYPEAIHNQPAYAGRIYTVPQGLPNLSDATPRILSLPLYPELSPEDVRMVAKTVLELTNPLA
jgi:dTDP-4-amino-4,6-dideoxygalactose transaminase